MIDPEEVREARQQARLARAAARTVDASVARRCLALNRSENWPVSAIATELGLSVPVVLEAIEQARRAGRATAGATGARSS